MKTLTTLLFAVVLVAGSAVAAPQFEGKMKMKMTSDGKSQEVAYATKGARVRVEMNTKGGASAMIMDMNAREIIMLMPEQKMYMVMPMKDVVDAVQDSPKTGASTLEKTGETEKILGYTATKYLAKDPSMKEPVEIWATEGLGSFVNPNSMGGPMGRGKKPANAWENELREKGFFPLRTVVKDRKSEMRMEVVSLEKMSLPDSFFSPPSDFQKFALPGGMGGLIPGLGGK